MFAATLHPFPVSEFLLNRHSTFVWKIFTLDYPTGLYNLQLTNSTKHLGHFLEKVPNQLRQYADTGGKNWNRILQKTRSRLRLEATAWKKWEFSGR